MCLSRRSLALLAFALAGCLSRSTPDAAEDALALDTGAPADAVNDLASEALADAPTESSLEASVLAVELGVRPNGDMAVSELVDLRTAGARTVELRYDTGTGAMPESRIVPVSDGAQTVPLLGLLAGVRYNLLAVASDGAGRTATAGPVSFTLPPMPSDLPPLHITTRRSGPSDVLVASLLTSTTGVGGLSYAALIDRNGRYLWYRRGGQATPFGFDFQRWNNGRFTVFQLATGSYEEVDLLGNVARRWLPPQGAVLLDGHDVQLFDDRTMLAMVVNQHYDDTRPYVDGGVPEAQVLDLTLQRLHESGDASVLWSSWPTIPLSETDPSTLLAGSGPVDPLHPNSVVQLADGNLLLSLRNTDTVYKINPRTGAILWRLGGPRSDFTFLNDPLGRFSHQHFARILPNGELLLFDNGNGHTPPLSRAVQYRLDETARTATLTWEYRHSPPHYSRAAGSVQRLPSGNTLISWGLSGLNTEVRPDGTIVWEMQLVGWLAYRLLSLDPASL